MHESTYFQGNDKNLDQREVTEGLREMKWRKMKMEMEGRDKL